MPATTAAPTKPSAVEALEQPAELREAEALLHAATARFDAIWGRADELQRRYRELVAHIADEDDDAKARALRVARAEITSDLVHLPDDAAALAERYANALLAWARRACHWADSEIARTRQAYAEPGRLATRHAEKLSPARAVMNIDPVADDAARAELDRLNDVLTPLRQQHEEASLAKSQAIMRLQGRFGARVSGPDVDTAEVERWVDDVRRTARRRLAGGAWF